MPKKIIREVREEPVVRPIHPRAIYHLGPTSIVTGLPESGILRECRLRRLRFARRGGRVCFLGQWILDWIEAGADALNRVKVEADQPAA